MPKILDIPEVGRVQFPDLQIEFLWPDDRRDVENVEVLTPHYRGAHTSGKVSAGFKAYRFSGGRVGFDTDWVDNADVYCGSASGLVSQ